jgi:hypothetical protein
MNIKTTPESRRIIFLDIDGVVLPLSQPTRRRYEDYAPDQIPQPLQRLVALLDEYPQIELVLSSSWRVDYGIERARELLPGRHRQKLIGVTPVIGNGSDRGAECLLWLASQGPSMWIESVDSKLLGLEQSLSTRSGHLSQHYRPAGVRTLPTVTAIDLPNSTSGNGQFCLLPDYAMSRHAQLGVISKINVSSTPG